MLHLIVYSLFRIYNEPAEWITYDATITALPPKKLGIDGYVYTQARNRPLNHPRLRLFRMFLCPTGYSIPSPSGLSSIHLEREIIKKQSQDVPVGMSVIRGVNMKMSMVNEVHTP